MRLTTVGRRSGKQRSAILGYYEDGPNVVTMAMNGWAEAEPAWWLNLQAHLDTTVELPAGKRAIHGRAAQGEEHERLWARWRGRSTSTVVSASPSRTMSIAGTTWPSTWGVATSSS